MPLPLKGQEISRREWTKVIARLTLAVLALFVLVSAAMALMRFTAPENLIRTDANAGAQNSRQLSLRRAAHRLGPRKDR